jgi:hypothetical protein
MKISYKIYNQKFIIFFHLLIKLSKLLLVLIKNIIICIFFIIKWKINVINLSIKIN